MIVDAENRVRLLQSCKGGRALLLGRQVHLALLKSGLVSSLYWGNCLLQMYGRCGDDDHTDAHRLFEEMPLRNCFSWNSLIDANLKSGRTEVSVDLFDRMPQKNSFSWNSVIAGLTKNGDMTIARRVFEEMPIKEAVACNCMMHGYVRSGCPREALRLYKDSYVLATALCACAHQLAYNSGRQIHAHILVGKVEFDSALGSALVDMYGKCGDLDHALSALKAMPEPDEFSLSSLLGRLFFHMSDNPSVILWNSLLTAYVSNGRGVEALELFRMMVRDGVAGDSSSLTTVLSACASLGNIQGGRLIHSRAFRAGHLEDVAVGTALVDLYSKNGSFDDACRVFDEVKHHDTILLNSMITAYSNCGRVQEARKLFDTMPSRSLISWNSMLVGYSKNGFAADSLELFSEMHSRGLKPDRVAFASAVSACLRSATTLGLQSDEIISTSLVDLYCKCGNVREGRILFESIAKSDEALWNSMLMGYAANGCGSEVLKLFESMREANACPNEVTFVAVLSGCCHCGLVDEGRRLFHAMQKDFKIVPTSEHYSCVVDLLVRAGRLGEAWSSSTRCPSRPMPVCCRELMALDPRQPGVYVQLSTIFAGRGMWESSVHVRRQLQKRQINKNPGCSWLDY
ncbi:unnamed protein product [Spirodela intermedia]|uniref:Uncharacterized protein n=1 Tax=Spirodela intermedia TaxID=51605 RepID=A0A7I8IS75_SPIIN|nr:unnamed protein product [Spirodela intermedia]CAA6660387.1 unnamed protein product [Spirodela intermedia]